MEPSICRPERLPYDLVRHPVSAAPAVRRIAARAHRTIPEGLMITFLLEGEFERLAIPPFAGVRPGERLWTHTCFEVFLAREGSEAYGEVNLAPSGAWAAYAFRRYREAIDAPATAFAPEVHVRRSADRLELEAVLALDLLDPELAAAPLHIGLAAVVEDDAGGLSWWALRHAAEKPDFHRPEGFVLHL